MFMSEPTNFTADKSAPTWRGELRLHEPMAKHVSWRAGGSVARAYIPADLADLVVFLRTRDASEDIYFVGLGSNLLVRDGGLNATVIFMHAVLNQINLIDSSHIDGEAGHIEVEAGVAAPKVARFAARHDLANAEFLAGIPGTLGGALAMNAGCYGWETWQIVESVKTIDRNGTIRTRAPSDFEITYRHVELKKEKALFHPSSLIPHPSEVPHSSEEEWFVSTTLKLPAGDGEVAKQKIKELLTKRIATQPLSEPNAGSVFRNPKGDHAARLIEACGLKGFRIGGAEVSRKHANFIVNTGNATAADIEQVIEHVHAQVLSKHRVELIREVRIVGNNSI
ncbi:MAG: UDP-N-acetylenolpyruvoylglucosamine reductase [Pseudomonadota bacterium]|jgi:UDP-N-acetylmuramate dehydrogenase